MRLFGWDLICGPPSNDFSMSLLLTDLVWAVIICKPKAAVDVVAAFEGAGSLAVATPPAHIHCCAAIATGALAF